MTFFYPRWGTFLLKVAATFTRINGYHIKWAYIIMIHFSNDKVTNRFYISERHIIMPQFLEYEPHTAFEYPMVYKFPCTYFVCFAIVRLILLCRTRNIRRWKYCNSIFGKQLCCASRICFVVYTLIILWKNCTNLVTTSK